jgi:hypothetical protein
MAVIDEPVRHFVALQILIELSVTKQPVFKIETYQGPVIVHMDRNVLNEFFSANRIRLELLKTPEPEDR